MGSSNNYGAQTESHFADFAHGLETRLGCGIKLLDLQSPLRLRHTRARAVRNVLGNVYLSSLTKNLWYEECEQLDSRGGGALS